VDKEFDEWEEKKRLGRRRRWFNIVEAKHELEKHKPVQGTYLNLLKGYEDGHSNLYKPFNMFEHQAISNNSNNNSNTNINYYNNHSHLYHKHHHYYNNRNHHHHHHSHNNHSNIMPSMISSSMPYSAHSTNGATSGLVASAVSLPSSTNKILLPK
jgi:hypothetical protein